jgi:hypothetical protein
VTDGPLKVIAEPRNLGREIAELDPSKIRKWDFGAPVRFAASPVDLGLYRPHLLVGVYQEVARAAGRIEDLIFDMRLRRLRRYPADIGAGLANALRGSLLTSAIAPWLSAASGASGPKAKVRDYSAPSTRLGGLPTSRLDAGLRPAELDRFR